MRLFIFITVYIIQILLKYFIVLGLWLKMIFKYNHYVLNFKTKYVLSNL